MYIVLDKQISIQQSLIYFTRILLNKKKTITEEINFSVSNREIALLEAPTTFLPDDCNDMYKMYVLFWLNLER